MYALKSHIALVTGVSRKVGIGAEIVRMLAERGADVFTTYYRAADEVTGLAGAPDEPEEILGAVRESGVRAAALEIDLADPQAPAVLFDRAERDLGRVSILINNAAYSTRDGIDALDAEQLDNHYAVNVRAMALLCAEFVRRYRRRRPAVGCGRIINVTSGQGVGPMPGELAYVASKGAVDAFTVSLSAEVAPLGITVNAVDPGITDTGWIPDELKARWQDESPMGRVGTPADAARLIGFLASDEARWITGQILRSRGGM
jgi:3-oxoacyl-[acyl-carrier protein] reductase